MQSTYTSDNTKPRTCVRCAPCGTSIPDRIGIIGNTHGVSASSRPKPKKLAINIQNPPLNKPAIKASSDCRPAARAGGAFARNGVDGVAAPAGEKAASVTLAVCSCGG